MLNRLANPKSMIGLWLTLGLVVGMIFSYAIGNIAIGIPMGLALSMLLAKVSYQVSRVLLHVRH